MTTLEHRPNTALLVIGTEWGAPPPDEVIAHTNPYWAYQTAPGCTAATVDSKDVDFGGDARGR